MNKIYNFQYMENLNGNRIMDSENKDIIDDTG